MEPGKIKNMDSHKKHSIIGVVSLVLLTLFVIAAIAFAIEYARDSDSGTDKVEETDSEIDTSGADTVGEKVDLAETAYLYGNTAGSRNLLNDIAADESNSVQERQVALDALADQCFLASDTQCLEDLFPKYDAAGLDKSSVQGLVNTINEEQSSVPEPASEDISEELRTPEEIEAQEAQL